MQMVNAGINSNKHSCQFKEVKRMDKQYYTPDRTWKNVWTVLRSKRSSPLVLACKKCTEGVSPKEKKYLSVIVFLCYSIGFLLPIILRIFVFPERWSKTIKTLVSILVLLSSWLPFASIPVLISFHFPKLWVPATVSQSD